jgi:hypothetical protein
MSDHYDYRFVSIRDIAINKKPTRISNAIKLRFFVNHPSGAKPTEATSNKLWVSLRSGGLHKNVFGLIPPSVGTGLMALTRISPLDGLHDSPERMLKINSPHHLQFKQLVGAG